MALAPPVMAGGDASAAGSIAPAGRIVIQAGETVEQAFRRLGQIDKSVYVVTEGGARRMTTDSAPIGNLADLTSYLKAYGLDVAVSVKEMPYIRVVVSDGRAVSAVLQEAAKARELAAPTVTTIAVAKGEPAAPVKMQFGVSRGDSLRQTLEGWARQSGWRTAFEVKDWLFGSDASFSGDFKGVVDELFSTLNQQLTKEQRLFGEFHDRNTVLRVGYAAAGTSEATRSLDRMYLPVAQMTCAPLSATTVNGVSFADRPFAQVMDTLLAGTHYSWSAKGALPKVKISASNVNGTLAKLLPQFFDETNLSYAVRDCEIVVGP